jgi:hypothetical protein
MLDVLDDTVDILEVFPNKATDFEIFWNGFEAFWSLVSCFQAFDRNIIDKWQCDIRDFILKEESEISMLDLHRVGVTHRNRSEAKSSK